MNCKEIQCDGWRARICRSCPSRCVEEVRIHRQRRHQQLNDVKRRAIRAQHLVLLGELSSARQALEGADLAPPNDQTLLSLRSRPARPRAPLLFGIFPFRPASPLQLDEDVFAKNIRSSKRGVAGGPSGMTLDHLRPILDSPRDTHVLCLVAEILARAEVPDEIVENLAVEHQTLLDGIPSLEDLQCGWALMLHCASARANYFIRVVRPECSHRFARLHDEGWWRCLCSLLNIPRDCVAPAIKDQCFLPLVLGGLGLRSATRTRQSAFWASWADALHMIHQRHPEVADRIVVGLPHPEGLPNLSGAAEAANSLRGVEDFALNGGTGHEILSVVTDAERALIRAQSGPGGGTSFSASPSCFLARIDSHLFRVLLLRRLQLPLLRASADVAVHLILVATIGQHARFLEFWGGMVLLWSRQQHGSAAKEGRV